MMGFPHLMIYSLENLSSNDGHDVAAIAGMPDKFLKPCVRLERA